jgi:hypothetical protein
VLHNSSSNNSSSSVQWLQLVDVKQMEQLEGNLFAEGGQNGHHWRVLQYCMALAKAAVAAGYV